MQSLSEHHLSRGQIVDLRLISHPHGLMEFEIERGGVVKKINQFRPAQGKIPKHRPQTLRGQQHGFGHVERADAQRGRVGRPVVQHVLERVGVHPGIPFGRGRGVAWVVERARHQRDLALLQQPRRMIQHVRQVGGGPGDQDVGRLGVSPCFQQGDATIRFISRNMILPITQSAWAVGFRSGSQRHNPGRGKARDGAGG